MSLNNNLSGSIKPESAEIKRLSVAYRPWKKLVSLFGLLVFLALAGFCLTINFIILEVTMVVVAFFLVRYMADGLMTRDITFYPDRIIKRSYLGETVIPTQKLVMTREDSDIRFFHGAKENIRESLRISGGLISSENSELILAYAQQIYQIKPYLSGALRSTTLAHNEFIKAVSSFRLLRYCTAIYLIVYVICASYVAEEYEIFNGFASQPSYPIRLLCVGIAITAYLFLKRLAANASENNIINKAPVMVRCQQAYNRAYTSAFVACGVAGLGLLLFLLFGDKLDFYLFLLVGIVYFYDFYPRLSTWERAVDNPSQLQQDELAIPNMPRRSMQVSLMLLGTLSVLSYSANRPYLPASRQECKDEQGNPKPCQSGSHSSGWHGSSSGYRGDDGSSSRAGNTGNVRRGGFGFFGSFHGFSGG